MIYILTYLNLLLDTVLLFSLFPLISYLDVNKHSTIVEYIIWFYRSCQLKCPKC